jgi:hypothetical protein
MSLHMKVSEVQFYTALHVAMLVSSALSPKYALAFEEHQGVMWICLACCEHNRTRFDALRT